MKSHPTMGMENFQKSINRQKQTIEAHNIGGSSLSELQNYAAMMMGRLIMEQHPQSDKATDHLVSFIECVQDIIKDSEKSK